LEFELPSIQLPVFFTDSRPRTRIQAKRSRKTDRLTIVDSTAQYMCNVYKQAYIYDT